MNLVELSQRIKNYRLDRRLTLEEVATHAGLTTSWLSKVENFRVTPSLQGLAKIAEALGMTLSELVEGLDDKPNPVIVRKEERQEIERDDRGEHHSIYESLAFKRPNRMMDPFLLKLPPGGGRKEVLAHEGEEFLSVLSGQVKFEYAEEIFLLRNGDSLYFDGSVPHRVFNPFKRAAEVLLVCSKLIAANSSRAPLFTLGGTAGAPVFARGVRNRANP